jgi:hypothetical protein
MLNRSHACVALILCSSAAFAQEATTPSASTSSSSTGSGSLLTPYSSLATPAAGALGTPATPTTTGSAAALPSGDAQSTTEAVAPEATEGFALPGGYGYSPLNFTPGQGLYDRQPLSFSTTVQQGYDDNIYGSSGKLGAEPVKGSTFTTLSQGVDLLLSQSRVGLSLQANAGGQYYYDRAGDQLTPNGSINLLFAYKITPRAQFSAVINGAYTTNPSLSVLNGLTQSNGKGYFTVNSKFDLLYQWTARISTDTTYTAVGTAYSGSTQSSSDYITQTIGQSVRYLFTPLVTGVAEVRASQSSYDSQSQFDSKTYYYLAGADFTLTRRLNASFRAGGSTMNYDNGDLSSQSSPYAEASLDYVLSRVSTVSLNGRYGLNNNGASTSQSGKSTRVGVAYKQTFTPKLQGNIGVSYEHDDASTQSGVTSNNGQDAINVNAGVSYALTQKLSLFTNYTHFQVFNAGDPYLESSRNMYYLGATYQY